MLRMASPFRLTPRWNIYPCRIRKEANDAILMFAVDDRLGWITAAADKADGRIENWQGASRAGRPRWQRYTPARHGRFGIPVARRRNALHP